MGVLLTSKAVIELNFKEFVPFEASDVPVPFKVADESFARMNCESGMIELFSISHMMPFDAGDPGEVRHAPGELEEFRDGMVENVMSDFRHFFPQNQEGLIGKVEHIWTDLQIDLRGNNLAIAMLLPVNATASEVEVVVYDHITHYFEKIICHKIGGKGQVTNEHPAPRIGLKEPCHCGSGKRYKNCCRKVGR
jgi:SEC-C motif